MSAFERKLKQHLVSYHSLHSKPSTMFKAIYLCQWRRQAWGTGARAPPLEFDARTNFYYTVGKKIVFFLLPEAFCGLKYAENAIVGGAPPRTRLGELTTLPQTP